MVHDPQRYRDRKEPKVADIGDPPGHLSGEVCAAWMWFVREIPWLKSSDRTILEIAAHLRAKLTAGEATVGMMTELRQVMVQLGATPSARTRVSVSDDEQDNDDPAAEFFN